MAFTLTPEREVQAAELIKRYPVPRAACIPILHLCQQQEGWVSPEVLAYVANKVGLTTSQVQGVVTFYTSFHQEPIAPNVVWVCRTLSCDLRGGKLIQEQLEKKLGCGPGETSRDGKFTLKKAECLAACGQAPMVQINDEFYENLTLEKLDRIIDDYARKTPAQPEAGLASTHAHARPSAHAAAKKKD
jgi:NADH-quinone oxidoreductase subunit E